MIHYLDDYRKARRVGENQGEKREEMSSSAAVPTSNVFQFRHPRVSDRRPAAFDSVYDEIDQDLDFVYALAAQS